LKDFNAYIKNDDINEETIVKYVSYLMDVRALGDSTINRKLVVLKMDCLLISKGIYKSKLLKEAPELTLMQHLTI